MQLPVYFHVGLVNYYERHIGVKAQVVLVKYCFRSGDLITTEAYLLLKEPQFTSQHKKGCGPTEQHIKLQLI